MSEDSKLYQKRLFVGLVVAVGALLLDPYSFGDSGGELSLRSRPWQSAAAAAQAAALIAAAVYVWLSGFRRARILASAELLSFVALNAIYLLRDGTMRFDAGYTGDTTVVFMIVVGSAARWGNVALLNRLTQTKSPTDQLASGRRT